MKHFKIEYDPKRRNLKLFHNGKLIGGCIGPIAEERYRTISAEMAKCDEMVTMAKAIINGQNKSKKKAI
jgi:hypothetical protein